MVKVKFLSFGLFSNIISQRSTIFGVWKYIMIYMSVPQVLFDHDLNCTVHCTVLSFCVLVYFSHTLCNKSTIIVVWNDCKVYMSSGQMSSDLDLIFMVQWL